MPKTIFSLTNKQTVYSNKSCILKINLLSELKGSKIYKKLYEWIDNSKVFGKNLLVVIKYEYLEI
jgi:hypothetical protein